MGISRTVFLNLAKNRTASQMATRYGLRWGAKRFVAGQTLDEALAQIQRLNDEGIVATLDRLGEFVNSVEEANRATGWALETLDGINRSKVNSHLSIKLTQFGLDLGVEICEANVRKILIKAQQYEIFVRIDMEDYPRCQKTIDLYQKLHADYPLTGLVLQSYLYRAEQDTLDLQANLRVVKGAYKEPSTVAFPEKKQVDDNLCKLIKLQMDNGNYVAIASHDEKIINWSKEYAEKKVFQPTVLNSRCFMA